MKSHHNVHWLDQKTNNAIDKISIVNVRTIQAIEKVLLEFQDMDEEEITPRQKQALDRLLSIYYQIIES